MVKVGIIGGSGVDDPKIFEDYKKIKKHTPYGQTSDLLTVGKLNGVDVVIVPRHGDSHRVYPSVVNYRANIWAMKELGVTHIIAPSAVGSLREDYKPGELVFTDQFIDRTTKRHSTFYEGVEVCHIPMAEPFCSNLRSVLKESADSLGIANHSKGTIVVVEGPRFSTKAESNLFRSWGCDIIGMTTVPEAVLAREAGICYAAVSMVTDYDCWHSSHESVTVDVVMETMRKNSENIKKLLGEVIPRISGVECKCREDYKNAMM